MTGFRPSVFSGIFSIFDPLFELISSVLAWVYVQPIFGGSFGGAIIGLTLMVMLIMSPLTYRATKSSLRMQKLQPEISRLQKQHKGDRETMNQEIFALYKEHQVNPAGACLPLLLQSPVFIILYNVIRGLTRRGGGEDRTFNPNHLSPDSQMWLDLDPLTEMSFLGMDLAISAQDALRNLSFVSSLPFLALIAAVTGTSYYQQWQISGRSSTEMNPQQKMLLRIMPPFFAIISFTFSAALVLYFLTSNLFRVAQQGFIGRTLYSGKGDSAPDAATENAAVVASEAKSTSAKPSGSKKQPKGSGSNAKKSDAKKSAAKKPTAKSADKKPDRKPSNKIGRTRLDGDELPPKRARSAPSSSSRRTGGRVTPSKKQSKRDRD